MSDYDWRQHWQPTLRCGDELRDLFQLSNPLRSGETLIGVVRESNGDEFPSSWNDDGSNVRGVKSKLDLVPVEKQPTYRPFRSDEWLQLFGRIVRQMPAGNASTISGYSPESGMYYTTILGSATAEKLLANYVFADGREDDGKPVGVLE